MFVPYNPDLCFDVFRPTDRCVCGASAVVTAKKGIDTGYCAECAKKRNEFIDEVIGNIEMEQGLVPKSLVALEEIRKNILKERFCYMIDRYFASHQKEEFSLPYDDLSFLEKIYREKRVLTADIILPVFSLNESPIGNLLERQYNNYYKKLCEMHENDGEKLEEVMFLQTGVHRLEYNMKHSKNK